MLVTFDEIKNEIYSLLKVDSSDTSTIDASENTSIALRINQMQDAIIYDRGWEWRKRTLYATLRKPYSDGTITVTENSRTVTGSGTTFTDSMKIGFLCKGSRVYKIARVNSATSLTLSAPYDQATESGASYSIVFPDVILPHTVSAIVTVKVRGNEINVVDKAQLVGSRATRAIPNACAVEGGSDEDYYNTGSVAVTNGSTSVVGTGTTWTEDMEGMSFRVNEFSKPYIIKSVNSGTTLTLRDAYEGETGSGKSYAVAPKGSMILSFRASPDNYYSVEVEYLVASEKLVSGNAYSIIPNHTPLLHGSLYLAGPDFQNKNPVRIQQARADYERTLKQLRKEFKVVGNLRWTSPGELRARQSATTFDNPLSSNRRLA